MNFVNFCLSSESFEDMGYRKEDIYENINHLDQINNKIKDLNDTLFRHDLTIYDVNIFNGLRAYEFITDPNIDPYYKQKFRMILERHTKSYTDEDIVKYVGFHKINDNFVSVLDELIEFYYEYIGNIHDEEDFFERIKVHFPELEFSVEIIDSLKTIDGSLEGFSTSIVNALIHLRDDLKDFINESKNLDEALKKISATSGFKTTLEGRSDASTKKKMSFKFKIDDSSEKNICCEPHMKFEDSSVDGDNKYYKNRLHFKEGDVEINKGNKILIGYIGKHLKFKKKYVR